MLVLRTAIVFLTASTVVALALLGNGWTWPSGVWGAPPASQVATPTPSEIPSNLQQALRASSEASAQIALMAQGLLPAPLAAPQPAGGGPSAAGVGGGIDVLINDPSVDTPEHTTQSEISLAVHGSTVCAGFNDSGVGGFSGLARSADLGASWSDQGGIGNFGDPVLAVHQATGTFYYAQLAFPGGISMIAVAKSTDDCHTFPVLANASPATSHPDDFQDKPWIAVDNSGGPNDGNVYVCWTRFVDRFPGPDTSGEIRFSRSTDGGVTFGSEQVISLPTDNFPVGCDVDVGPNGEVYVAWGDRNFFAGFPVRIRRSLDGGLTFPEPPVQVNSAPIRHAGLDRIIECGTGAFRLSLNGDIRIFHLAWMAVDTTGGPFDGNIYVAWMHDPPGAVDNSDVFLSYSTDGGLTWAPQVQIAGGTVTDQFQPFVEVGGEGTVAIAWYDRRNDPINNFNIDVYQTFSRDGGLTFEPMTRVTDISFPVPPITGQPDNFDPFVSPCYMGEYLAIAADADNFYYAWGDNRNTVVSATYPAGRPDPDVFFDRQAIPALASPTPTPPSPVGGVAVGPDVAELPLESVDPSSSGGRLLIVMAMGAIAAFMALGAASWYTRRP